MITAVSVAQQLLRHHRRIIHDSHYRRSAVLVPVMTVGDVPHLVFTKRTDSVDHHKGQISFPGGAEDATDASAVVTALREAEEEIGLSRDEVNVLGMLDDLWTPTGFIITPVVGWIDHRITFVPSEDEVSEVFSVPLTEFYDLSKRRSEMRTRDETAIEIYFYDVWKEPVWGATAHCVKQLTDLLEPLISE
jgi:8-oxo-dGTP pyrophosphatase MutT (NUDIX family)